MHIKANMQRPTEVLTLNAYHFPAYPMRKNWLDHCETDECIFRTVRKEMVSLKSNLTKLQCVSMSSSAQDLTRLEPPKSILKRSTSADSAKIQEIKQSMLSTMSELSLNDDNVEVSRPLTPPKSPGKNVTFAEDKFLVQVRNFIPSNDNLDLWPSYQGNNLYDIVVSEDREKHEITLNNCRKRNTPYTLKLCFSEPSSMPDFLERFKHRCVALEKCATRDRDIIGVIRVKNIEYKKQVIVRYTTDSWVTSNDIEATYLPSSNDGDTDRFTFTLIQPKGRRELEFAVCYKTSTSEFWDNNYNRNYKIEDAILK